VLKIHVDIDPFVTSQFHAVGHALGHALTALQ
jgi:hypothetical protein